MASADFLCDRCAMEAQQLLSCSLLSSPCSSLLFLSRSGQLQQREALFVLTSPLLSADLWSTKDSDLTLATHMRIHRVLNPDSQCASQRTSFTLLR